MSIVGEIETSNQLNRAARSEAELSGLPFQRMTTQIFLSLTYFMSFHRPNFIRVSRVESSESSVESRAVDDTVQHVIHVTVVVVVVVVV